MFSAVDGKIASAPGTHSDLVLMSKAKKPFDAEAQTGFPDLLSIDESDDDWFGLTIPQSDIPPSREEPCFGQTQPDIPASKGGSQAEKRVKEDKGIKRKRTSVKGDAKPPVLSERKRWRPLCSRRDYDDQFKGIIQLIKDNRENLRSRLTDVRQHSSKVTPKSKQVQTRLRNLRLAGKEKCCTLIKAEKEKRLKTETDLRLEKNTHSKLAAQCAKLETEAHIEKTKRQSELLEQTRLKRDLQSERAKREKLESDLKSEETKRLKLEGDIASEKARRMLLEEEAKKHAADRVKSEENIQLERGKRLKLEEDIQSEKGKRLKLEADVRLSEQKIDLFYREYDLYLANLKDRMFENKVTIHVSNYRKSAQLCFDIT
ncbi:hypothetical protein R1sor_026584 [Riccia sorocarpa]|uniref:Uncharacterized protein n=1 Tax=Riccia sorocarpa TaxID=122646 RepID=A0ABD3GDH3_9MARC